MKTKIFLNLFIGSLVILLNFYCSSSKKAAEPVKNTEVKNENSSITWTSGTQSKTAKIDIQQDKYDFGEAEEGIDVVHYFEISNKGTEVLKISDVETSCGCTSAPLDEKDKTIEPGKSIKLKVSFNTRGRVGPNTKIITINSNDPNNKKKEMYLTGRVVPKK